MNKIEQLHLDAIKDEEADCMTQDGDYIRFVENHNYYDVAIESTKITEQIAIEFMDWCRDNTVVDAAPKPYHRKLQIRMTTKELFQEFLKTKQ